VPGRLGKSVTSDPVSTVSEQRMSKNHGGNADRSRSHTRTLLGNFGTVHVQNGYTIKARTHTIHPLLEHGPMNQEEKVRETLSDAKTN
jgi:uncharacterized protein YfaQ (DUF2300 family)